MICEVDGCNRKIYASKKCNPHYRRLMFGGGLNENVPIKNYAPIGDGLELIKNTVKSKFTGCVIWPYGKDSRGYGQVFYEGKRIKAHRLSKMLYDNIDHLDKDRFVCHKCDTPLCINPRHLYIGDAKTNREDCHRFWLSYSDYTCYR